MQKSGFMEKNSIAQALGASMTKETDHIDFIKSHVESSEVDISFFVPAYNEENNITDSIKTIFSALSKTKLKYEIMVINDGSKDNTIKKILDLFESQPQIPLTVVSNKKNKGLGFNYFNASHLAKGKYYLLVNGDNDIPEETILKIIDHIGKYDIVIPYLGENEQRGKRRKLISKTFTTLVNLLSGNNLHYYNFPILHKIENVRGFNIMNSGYSYQAELLCSLLKKKKSFTQIQVTHTVRQHGDTKAFKLKNFVAVGKSLVRIFINRFK